MVARLTSLNLFQDYLIRNCIPHSVKLSKFSVRDSQAVSRDSCWVLCMPWLPSVLTVPLGTSVGHENLFLSLPLAL